MSKCLTIVDDVARAAASGRVIPNFATCRRKRDKKIAFIKIK